MTHALKTWPEYYKAVESGEKTFEIRKMDRSFKVGDIVILQEYELNGGGLSDDDLKGQYTGKELKRRVTYILHGATSFGLVDDYCILGLKEIE